VVLVESDGRTLEDLGDEPINVIVFYISNPPIFARAPLTCPDLITFDDLARLYDFAQVARDHSLLDLHGWVFQDELGCAFTREGFTAHVRDDHGLDLRPSRQGGTTLETLDPLRLASLHGALHLREPRVDGTG
jgi:hypothetical protein